MARYVLLRVEDDGEADDLLRDIALYPSNPLLTPCQENTVSVELVEGLDPSDCGRPSAAAPALWTLQEAVRASRVRADELAAEWWATS